MLNVDRIRGFFRNFGYEPGVNYKPISRNRYLLILETTKRWYDASFGQFVMGCFVGVEQDESGAYTKYMLEYPGQDEILGYLHAQWVA
jgi:hypothetical protein